MPALPLDEAGKYVAAAYIFVLLVITFYLAIVAAKLARIERELNTLTKLADKGKQDGEGDRERRTQ